MDCSAEPSTSCSCCTCLVHGAGRTVLATQCWLHLRLQLNYTCTYA
jgi:hypothetical protein